MKQHILYIIFSLSVIGNTFGQFTDDFSDGDFTANPGWSGDVSLFTINASNQLQSQNPGEAYYYLSTPSTLALNAEWEFYINLKFGTSGVNYVDVHLISDDANTINSQNGYFVRVGNIADEISLYKIESGTEVPIIDGTDGLVNSSSNNVFRIKIERDNSDNWSLYYDKGDLGNYMLEGTVTDASVNASTHFGVVITQSPAASAVNNHYLDDFIVQTIPTDITPPTLINTSIELPKNIRLTFDEALESVPVESLTNYSLNNGYGNPTNATQTLVNEVLIEFSTDFISADYTLSIDNIEDLNSNVAGTITSNFTVFIPDVADLRDVIINEFLPDPSPSVGLPEVEFVELYNRSDKAFDLANWTFSDVTNTATLPSFILAPDSYVVLCSNANASLFTGYGDVISVSSLPSLNNTGDQLTLKNDSEILIDYVQYDDDWYQNEDKNGGGFTLELINPNHVCGGTENWIASEDSQGGTPAAQNSVFNTTTGSELPSVKNITPLSDTQILIEFSETLDSLTIVPSNFVVDGIGIFSLNSTSSTAELILSNTLISGTEYTITISNLDDCTGNTIVTNGYTFEYLENPSLTLKDVVITEIMANPNSETTSPNAEYLEILNLSSSKLNLSGWQISDGSSTGTLGYYILESQEYLAITKNDNVGLFVGSIPVLGLNTFPSLNNTGDNITLKNENGDLLDSVAYKSSWYRSSIKDDGGFSLEIIDPDDICSNELNWIASEDTSGGTPGKQNSVFAEMVDNTGPKLISAFGISSDSVLLTFDEQIDLQDLIPANFSLSDGLIIDEIISEDLKTIYLLLSESTEILGGQEYRLTVSNVSDCPGNIIQSEFNSSSFSLIEETEIGDLLINEILFNPKSGGVDFVEFINVSSKFISLKDWQIANADDFVDSIGLNTIRTISESHQIIAPGDYLALTSDNILLKDQYPKSDENNFLELSSLPSYPDDEGTVVLLNPKDEIVDYFTYSEDFHAQVLNEDEGVSLERISITVATNLPENWFSAAASENYATPGYMNSQSRGSIINHSGEILIEPRVIIPDGDGIDDYATISYAFDQPGYAISVIIMDLQGREIKKIASNDFISMEGFYTWDGSDNDGRSVRVGYYIVYVEAFSGNGNVEKFKEKIVIGTRF